MSNNNIFEAPFEFRDSKIRNDAGRKRLDVKNRQTTCDDAVVNHNRKSADQVKYRK